MIARSKVLEMEKETERVENVQNIENATEIYDVIINDRGSNDIEINTKQEDKEIVDDESDSEVNDLKESVDDVNKLLAAQARAIEVFEMIKHLEVEMEVGSQLSKTYFLSTLKLFSGNA